MEHQQAQQQQQYLTLEGLEDSNARAVFVKLINVLLTVLQVSVAVRQWYSSYIVQSLSLVSSSSSYLVSHQHL